MLTSKESLINIPQKKLHGLDHLRSMAIFFVLLFHYGQLFPHPVWTNKISKFGWTGVDLFFVLSGYLIASQLFANIVQGKPLSYYRFFIKRFFRIIPAYLVVLTIYFCIPYAREWEGLAPLWKYLCFTQNLGLDIGTQRTFSHAWSLCIEEQFYLFLPLVLAVLLRLKAIKRGVPILIILFIAGFMIRYYAYTNQVAPFLDGDHGWHYWYTWIYYPTWCRLDGLLVGVSIAALFTFRPLIKERICRNGHLLLLISVIILTGAYILCLDQESMAGTVFSFPLVSIGYGFMLMGALSPSCFLYRSSSKITVSLATLSYSLYLTHKIVIHITQDQLSKLGLSVTGNIMFIACMISCLAAAFALNKLVEKPFMRLRDKILSS